MLEDYLKFDHGRGPLFTYEHLDNCFDRVQGLQLQERAVVRDELALTPFYAGHVLGAAMVLVECRGRSALYTGDFTMVPDHHLSAAWLPLCLQPDVMIVESTYATTIRSSKRQKELELCRKIQETLDANGKVLVPVSAMGKAQEFCLLCEQHWSLAGLRYPIYIARGLMEKALAFFNMFASWSCQSLRNADNPFDFQHVRIYDSLTTANDDQPMVLFAGTAMLNAGNSLQVFKRWAPDKRNLVIFPGYCLPGTVGHDVLRGVKNIRLGAETITVACRVEYMSHSDHTDARGILQLLSQTSPRHVVLVHGSAEHMTTFKPLVQQRLRVPCHDPGVGSTADLSAGYAFMPQEVWISAAAVSSAENLQRPPAPGEALGVAAAEPAASIKGLLVRKRDRPWELHDNSNEGAVAAGMKSAVKRHCLRHRHREKGLPTVIFQKAWVAELLPVLKQRGSAYSWTPNAPPLASGSKSFQMHELAIGSLNCRVSSSVEGKVDVDVDWEHNEVICDDSLLRFLEMVNAW